MECHYRVGMCIEEKQVPGDNITNRDGHSKQWPCPHRSKANPYIYLIQALSKAFYQIVNRPHNPVKQFVHKLRLHHLRNVGNHPFPGTGHPAGLGVGAAAARQHENARIGPFQGLQIGRKLPFRLRMNPSEYSSKLQFGAFSSMSVQRNPLPP